MHWRVYDAISDTVFQKRYKLYARPAEQVNRLSSFTANNDWG